MTLSTAKEKNKPAPQGQARGNEPASPVAANATAGGNVEQIRDILFGTQMKDYEERFLRLEENLIQQAADLRSNMNSRLDTLEANFRSVAEKLEGRIDEEKSDRASSVKELARELKSSTTLLERSITKLDGKGSQSEQKLQGALETQTRELLAAIKETRETLGSELDRHVTDLRDAKTDRNVLAEALREMASSLADEKVASKKG